MALALLMAVWAASGVVMMYVAYPETSAQERFARLPPLDMASCCDADIPEGSIASAALEMVDGRPMLLTDSGGAPIAIDLRSGGTFRADAGAAERIARAYSGTPSGPPTVSAIASDQWTVTGQFRAHAPLYKVSMNDAAGTVLYVSGVTGQVVQDTTRSERFWNWLGAIPHWLYFKQLREDGPLWSKVVIYSSLLGAFLTITGLYIGVIRVGRKGRRIPYRGAAWWHHVTGLVFGVLTLTWVASGLFSMQPWGWMESAGPGEELAALAGREATGEDAARLIAALVEAQPADVVRAELTLQGGEPYALLYDAAGRTRRASLPGLEPSPLRHADLDTLAARARPGERYAAGLILEPDAYHYGHKSDAVLPAWRVIYADEESTRLYFDPGTGELVNYVDGPSRTFRWWHLALHRFDFAQILRLRPVWDIVVLPLVLGVTLLCLIGLWLGMKRVLRTLAPRR